MSENSRGQNKNAQPENKGRKTSGEDMTSANSDHQNASAIGGGTTDMDNEATGNSVRSGSKAGGGSGITTKRNVTGSDYDGQLSE